MKKKLFISLLTLVVCVLTTAAQGIGTWKAYMAYHDVTWVERGDNTLYVLASGNLYSYNENDHSIQTYDKVSGLSDSGILFITWNRQAHRLVVIYQNYNIDLLGFDGSIVNISDYYTKSMTSDKTINNVYSNAAYVYLSTGFGIVKVNVKDAEISDTYNLGFKVDYCYIDNNQLYAASSTDGLYASSLSNNLLDKNQWERVGEFTQKTFKPDSELMDIAATLKPGGPENNNFAFMTFINNSLYTCSGIGNIPSSIQVLGSNDEWTIYPSEGISEKTKVNYKNMYCLDVDPKDPKHVFGGAQNGLYEYYDGQFINFYNDTNAPIDAFDLKNKEHEMIFGVKFDSNGDLWALNSLATHQAIIKYTTDKKWETFSPSAVMTFTNNRSLARLSCLIEDSRKLLWFVNDNHVTPALFCFQPSTETLLPYTTFINEDGTKLSNFYVCCVTEDKEGNMWIGTDVGPLMLEEENIGSDPSQVLFNQVKVPRNDGTDYADYLLSGVYTTCIAVDGGNRKWFGTKGLGVYLIDADNITEVHHFTMENSKLISDNIQSIAINHQTGEVYFGTDKGLCSFMSDATATNDEMTTDNVYAYPNPVRPGYSGLITVTGLSYQADVKIVTTNGVLVAEGKSNGGTFTWDGTDQKGKRVASGIYFVETATSSGEKGTVCKIAIVN